MAVDELRVFNALDKLPKAPEGSEEFLKKIYPFSFEKKYLIYKSHRAKKLVSCHCTACQSDFISPYVEPECKCSHGYYSSSKYFGFENTEFNEHVFSTQTTRCPICSEPVRAFHVSDIGKGYEDITQAFAKVYVIDGMIFYIRWLYRRFLNQDGSFSAEIFPLDGNVFSKDFRAYISKSCCSYNGYSGYQYVPYYRWFINVKYCNSRYYIPAINMMPITQEELLESEFPNCKLDLFIKHSANCTDYCFVPHYLNVYRKYPSVENLVMNDAVYLLNTLFAHTDTLSGFREYVNVKAKSPFSMLGLDKHEYDVLVRRFNFNFDKINFYARNKKAFPLSDFLVYEPEFDVSDLRLLEEFPFGFLKPLNYIKKQETKLNSIVPLHFLTDYWKMMDKLNVENVCFFPQNIVSSHDKAANAILALKNKDLSCKYILRFKALSKYNFEYKDLIIFPCSSDAELHREGEVLSHCVYGYAERYVEGKTALFFIRHKDKPYEPFYTLEFDEKNCSILQNHGYKNELYNPKDKSVIEFEKAWLAFAKKVKEKKYAKQRNSKIRKCTSAGA